MADKKDGWITFDGQISGFTGETAVVEAVRFKGTRTGSWVFEASCGTRKMFKAEHFHDPYGAAIAALNNHKCPKVK